MKREHVHLYNNEHERDWKGFQCLTVRFSIFMSFRRIGFFETFEVQIIWIDKINLFMYLNQLNLFASALESIESLWND